MERIIINEVDNTSNVEALSSYDVAYVPGFALGPVNSSNAPELREDLYRVPTLVRDKYEFYKLFGPTCPRFQQTQRYPEGFPDAAIKWGDNTSSYYSLKVNYFDDLDDIADIGWYTFISAMPVEDDSAIKQYYYVEYDTTRSTASYVLTPIGNTLAIAYNNEDINLPEVFGKSYYTATFEQVTIEEGAGPETAFYGAYTTVELTAETFEEIDLSKETYYIRTGSEGTYEYTALTTDDEFNSEAVYCVFDFNASTSGSTVTERITYYTKSNSPVTYTVQQIYHAGTTYYSVPNGVTEFTGDTFVTGTTYYEYVPFQQAYITVNTQTETTPIRADSSKHVVTSIINPSTAIWYENSSGEDYAASTDTFIDTDKDYYGNISEAEQPMFNGPVYEGNVMTTPGDADPGYRYALTLLSLGMPVYYEQMNNSENDINVSKMYGGLRARFMDEPTEPDYSFDSMGDYNVKFITTGGYPVFEYASNGLADAMITMAKNRKDSIALIDHTDNPARNLTTYDTDSIINAVREWNVSEDGTFGAMFTPWYECNHLAVNYMQDGSDEEITNNHMPASLAYLTALAVQLQNYNPWLAVSGVVRGVVPFCKELHTDKPLTNTIADSYQTLPNTGVTAISINPITYVRNYGYCLWGNRTLRNNSTGTKASSFLNIRSAISDIKKRLYEASQQTLFEQNTDVTWLNFKSLIMPLLETMVSDYILEDYAITRLFTDPDTGYPVPAYEVMAVIRIQPINSIEVFDLTIVMENTDDFNITTTENEL